jgi:hypothetical protein
LGKKVVGVVVDMVDKGTDTDTDRMVVPVGLVDHSDLEQV